VGLIAAGVPGPIPNAAHDQANLWTVYDWDLGLKSGIGVNWLGRREAAADAASNPGTIMTAEIASYVTMDGMIAYPVTDKLSLVLNGYNLANTYYYTDSYFSSPMENHVVPGTGRTFLLTANLSL
jgi:outer membrane receptor for monomeric catechols